MATGHDITIARIYDYIKEYDGTADDTAFRILVDRLWPRGISKDKAELEMWEKEIAPTTDLRGWFGHDPEKYDEFKKRYLAEIEANEVTKDFVETIQKQLKSSDIVLLYGAKDTEHNQAVVLLGYLKEHLK